MTQSSQSSHTSLCTVNAMSLTSRTAIRNMALACLVIASGSHAESSAPTIITFVPDDVLPEVVLSDLLSARRVADYRIVTVDSDGLRQLIRDASPSPTGSVWLEISLPLVNQSLISIELTSGEESYDGWQSGIASFFGKVAGNEMSSVQCVIAPDGSVSLVIRAAGKRYKLDKMSLLPYHIYWEDEGSSRRID